MGIRGGRTPLGAQVDHFVGEHPGCLAQGPGLAQAIHHDGVVQQAALPGQFGQAVEGHRRPGIARRADALKLQGMPHHFPALVFRAQARGHGHVDIGEKHLVEVALAHHRRNFADLDARRVHGNQQHRNPTVTPAIGIRAHQQQDEIRVIAIGRPDLAAIDDVLVPHPKRFRA